MLKNSILFSPVRIGPVTIPNRFMRSATYEGLGGSTGLPRSVLNKLIENLSANEVGLIVPGYMYPLERGKSAPRQCGMSRIADSQVWEPTIKTVHQNKSKIIFQICHGGSRCDPNIIHDQPIGCSPEKNFPYSREMTNEEIEETIDPFIQAAFRLQSIGVDGIQIHAAHGYLLSAFLSPYLNRRTDKWGGSLENRLRIVYEIARGIRYFVAPDFMVSIKMNGDDHVKGGITPEISSEYVKQLLPYIDLFEISGGLGLRPSYGIRCKYNKNAYMNNLSQTLYKEIEPLLRTATETVPYNEAYNLPAVETIHRMVPNANLAIVGGIRSIPKMEELLQNGTVKLISMSRPFMKQPSLVKDLRMGNVNTISCDSCGICSYYKDKLSAGYRCHNYK